ncbi:hypothetical protein ABIA99_005278 [Bradyrhizobium sp. LB12.1]|uniref:Arc family DNA-binding protein n=1 Tax=Bradyrhizobium sp. LB12.1 TaxID=3156327 RepID=UPI003398FE6D
MAKNPDQVVQVNLRITEELRLTLVAEAEKSQRSFNAELLHRLQESCRRKPRAREIVPSKVVENAVEMVLQRHGLIKKD